MMRTARPVLSIVVLGASAVLAIILDGCPLAAQRGSLDLTGQVALTPALELTWSDDALPGFSVEISRTSGWLILPTFKLFIRPDEIGGSGIGIGGAVMVRGPVYVGAGVDLTPRESDPAIWPDMAPELRVGVRLPTLGPVWELALREIDSRLAAQFRVRL